MSLDDGYLMVLGLLILFVLLTLGILSLAFIFQIASWVL